VCGMSLRNRIFIAVVETEDLQAKPVYRLLAHLSALSGPKLPFHPFINSSVHIVVVVVGGMNYNEHESCYSVLGGIAGEFCHLF
jgi:hypothetical protein